MNIFLKIYLNDRLQMGAKNIIVPNDASTNVYNNCNKYFEKDFF